MRSKQVKSLRLLQQAAGYPNRPHCQCQRANWRDRNCGRQTVKDGVRWSDICCWSPNSWLWKSNPADTDQGGSGGGGAALAWGSIQPPGGGGIWAGQQNIQHCKNKAEIQRKRWRKRDGEGAGIVSVSSTSMFLCATEGEMCWSCLFNYTPHCYSPLP